MHDHHHKQDRTQARLALSVSIVLPFEGVPPVVFDCLDDGCERRMIDWLLQRPALLTLIRDALELEEAA